MGTSFYGSRTDSSTFGTEGFVNIFLSLNYVGKDVGGRRGRSVAVSGKSIKREKNTSKYKKFL